MHGGALSSQDACPLQLVQPSKGDGERAPAKGAPAAARIHAGAPYFLHPFCLPHDLVVVRVDDGVALPSVADGVPCPMLISSEVEAAHARVGVVNVRRPSTWRWVSWLGSIDGRPWGAVTVELQLHETPWGSAAAATAAAAAPVIVAVAVRRRAAALALFAPPLFRAALHLRDCPQ